GIGRQIGTGREGELIFFIQIPIFLWSIKRQMRFEKSHGQEKGIGPFLELCQLCNSQVRCKTIRIPIIIYLPRFIWLHLIVHTLTVFTIGITKEGIPSIAPFSGVKVKLIPAVG